MGVQLTGESMQTKESDFGFFKLENNHDKAIVRLLHENYEDFSRRPIHRVKVPEYKYGIAVNCLRADSDPEEKCPFCSCKTLPAEQLGKRTKRIYIEFLVYKILDKNGNIIKDYMSSPKKMVWEKERRFDDKIFSLAARYKDLCDVVFQVERFGEKGSTDTSYDIYQIDVDKTLYPYELPEKTYNPDGIQVKDKTFDEMNYYIENGSFPPTDGGDQVERRSDVAQETQPPFDVSSQQTVNQQTTTQQQTQYVSRRRSI